VIEQVGRASVEDDFLRLNPKRTIGELVDMDEDGTFIVFATIIGVVIGKDWWYPACKFHKSVAPDSELIIVRDVINMFLAWFQGITGKIIK